MPVAAPYLHRAPLWRQTNAPPATQLTPGMLVQGRSALATVGATLLSHVPTAIGDVFAARAVSSLLQGQIPTGAIGGLIACQTAPYVLPAGVGILKEAWRAERLSALNQSMVSSLFGKTSVWLEGRAHLQENTQRIANDVPWIVGQMVDLGTQGTQLATVLGFQAVMLGVLLEPQLVASLAAAAALACAAGFVATRAIAACPKPILREGIDPHFQFGRVRNRMWDNTTLGNAYNFALWKDALSHATQVYNTDLLQRQAIRAVAAAVAQTAGGALVAMSLYNYGDTLWTSGQHDKFISYLLPVTARAASTLATSSNLMGFTVDFVHHLQIFKRLLDEIKYPNALDVVSKIDSDKIRILEKNGPSISWQQLMQHSTAAGRYTIRGENGAGKTMLMAHIKQTLGEACFMWPAHNDLMFDVGAASSGQTTWRALQALQKELGSHSAITTVILDEADANFDPETKQAFSRYVDTLAQRVRIIEVTHDEASDAPPKGTSPCV